MPAKRKGKKGSKLSRMSDEERARYLQHRAELELEAKRRKQQLIAEFTKNKLRHEEAFSRLNSAKINERWRFLLREIKCKELRQNVEYFRENFSRMLTLKNSIIQRLYDDLVAADMDHRKLQEAHIEIIDEIIGYKQRLACMHSDYNRKIHSIENRDIVDLNKLKKNMEDDCQALQMILKRQDKAIDETLDKTRTSNAVNMYNIEYLKNEIISTLERNAYGEMENLWAQLLKIISDYETDTEIKREQYEYLKEQDDTHRLETEKYTKNYVQLTGHIEKLKDDLETLTFKREASINELKKQVEHQTMKFWKLRREFSDNQSVDSTQLKKLSVISNVTIKELQKISDKGSALKSLTKLCSTLESDLPDLDKYSFSDTDVMEEQPFTDTQEIFDRLEKFWRRFNYTEADNILMKKELKSLSSENKQLRHALRTHLLSVSKTPHVRPFTSIVV